MSLVILIGRLSTLVRDRDVWLKSSWVPTQLCGWVSSAGFEPRTFSWDTLTSAPIREFQRSKVYEKKFGLCSPSLRTQSSDLLSSTKIRVAVFSWAINLDFIKGEEKKKQFGVTGLWLLPETVSRDRFLFRFSRLNFCFFSFCLLPSSN